MARVLIADDDPLAREFLRDVCIRCLGLKTVEAKNLREAVAITAEGGLDAVLIDQNLGDGKAEDYFAAAAKMGGAAASVPKWLITGQRPLNWDSPAMSARGVKGYLVKPCHMDEIRAALEPLIK
ncbi:MAG: response regulator [Elusimicrobiales bacterium]